MKKAILMLFLLVTSMQAISVNRKAGTEVSNSSLSMTYDSLGTDYFLSFRNLTNEPIVVEVTWNTGSMTIDLAQYELSYLLPGPLAPGTQVRAKIITGPNKSVLTLKI